MLSGPLGSGSGFSVFALSSLSNGHDPLPLSEEEGEKKMRDEAFPDPEGGLFFIFFKFLQHCGHTQFLFPPPPTKFLNIES